MKKMTVLVACALMLLLSFSWSWAKPFKPLSFSDIVEIPEEIVLPDFSRLEMSHTNYREATDGSSLMNNFYRDRDFIYLLDGNEIYPYLEVLKWEENEVHFICVMFLNQNGEMEAYVDEDAFYKPASGKIKRIDTPGVLNGLNGKIKKMPRENTDTKEQKKPTSWTIL